MKKKFLVVIVISLLMLMVLAEAPLVFAAYKLTEGEQPTKEKPLKCPDDNKPKNGDINGDSKSDWKYWRKEDEKGHDVEQWGIDQRPDAVPYFAKIFSKSGKKYFVGKCPFEGGINQETLLLDKNKDFTGIRHRSTDDGPCAGDFGRDRNKATCEKNAACKNRGCKCYEKKENKCQADDPEADGTRDEEIDEWEYEYDAGTHIVTKRHYETSADKDGVWRRKLIKKEENIPEEWPKAPPGGSFGDLPPLSAAIFQPGAEAMVELEGLPTAFAEISPSGGTITSYDGKLAWGIPTDGFSSMTAVGVDSWSNVFYVAPPNRTIIGLVYELRPSGNIYRTGYAATLTFKYPSGKNPNRLSIYRLDDSSGTWERLPTSSIDTNAYTISALTYHNTDYALMEEPPPTGVNTYWLMLAAISAMLAGGYLLVRGKSKFA